MTSKSSSTGSSVSFPSLLFLLFLGLKLGGVIDWSWWWVTSPLWIPLSVLIVIFTLLGAGMFVAHLRKTK